MLAEEELLRPRGVPQVGAAHGLVDLGQRNVERQVEGEHHARHQDDEHGERGILEIRQLHFHGTEFGAPADVRVVGTGGRRGRLPATRLPVRRLNVLEMLHRARVIQLDLFLEHDEGVAGEEVRQVVRQVLVDADAEQAVLGGLVHGAGDVVEPLERAAAGRVALAVVDVRADLGTRHDGEDE